MKKDTISRRRFLSSAACAGAAAPLFPSIVRARSDKPNILFLPVDDLRTQLGCYGHTKIHSPNIDRLAENGTVFSRAYCQVPVCGASRASLMSGVRPTRHRFIDYYTRLDEDLPGAPSLNRFLKNNGYTTVSNGKVYHFPLDDIDGWSEKPWRPTGQWKGSGYILPENQKLLSERAGRGPAYEKADVPDSTYMDGLIADKAIDDIRRLAKGDKPFFLASGFMKPHLPFVAPAKYWDIYRHEDIDLADNPFRPKGAPDEAMHNWVELRRYYGIPEEGPLPEETARMLVHGYYACVSYTDAQIGRVVAELDRLGLRDNTIVVLWGDHGWHLGEHGLWCKHCNFENVLHAPLIVSAPGFKGVKTDALVEFVDIYPSLASLCGFGIPEHLQGSSFVPLLGNPGLEGKKAAFSRYFDGDSVKTDRYRYTEWTHETMPPGSAMETSFVSRMLYDHAADPSENVNIADVPGNEALVGEMAKILHDGWHAVKK